VGPLFLCCNKTTTNKTKQEHGDASFLSLDELTRDLFADGLHASLEQALEEEVLAVSPTSGKMLGLVALHDPEKDEKAQLRVGGKQLRTELSQRCSYAVDLVGKVYVRFESIGYDYRFGVGTCFKISPSLLLTARRVVPETTWLDVQKQVDGKLQTFRVPFRRKGLHVTFRSSTRLINPRLLSGDEDCHAVTVLPSPQYPKQLAYCFPLPNGQQKGWDADDFCVLRLDNNTSSQSSPFHSRPFTYPDASEIQPVQEVFVVGYPAQLTRSRASIEYPQLDAEDIAINFGGFGAITETPDIGNFIYHNAPTLPGFSGGMASTFSSSGIVRPGFFSGIHVGGSSKLSQNFVIPTTNPNLASAYFDAIAIQSEEYNALKKPLLKPFYSLHRETLSDAIRDTLDPFFNATS